MTRSLSSPVKTGWPGSMKGVIVLLLKSSIGASLLVLMYRYGLLDFGAIFHRVSGEHLFVVLVAACGFIALALGALTWRMRLLLAVQGMFLPFSRMFAVTVWGNLVSAILPGIVAGDVVKMGILFRLLPRERASAAGAIVVDRILGLYGLIVLGSVSGWVALARGFTVPSEIIWTAILGTPVTTALLAILLAISSRIKASTSSARIMRLLGQLSAAVSVYRSHLRALAGALVLSVTVHLLTVATFVCCGAALLDAQPWTTHVLLDPLAMMLNALPLSPGGIGLAEGAFAFLFASTGSPNGALIGLMGRIVLYAVSAAVSIVSFMCWKKDHVPQGP